MSTFDLDGKYFDAGSWSNWGSTAVNIHSKNIEKVASSCHTPEKLLKTIDSIKASPNGRYVLLNALGSYEYYGPNSNGDAFNEWSLLGSFPPEDVLEFYTKIVGAKYPKVSVPTAPNYGLETFVSNAHPFKYHVNQDPKFAIGRVIDSAYNQPMRRVELIVYIDKKLAPELVDKLDNNELVPWSMGARLPVDVCSICNNPAKSRAEYCEHLSKSLGAMLPDGRKVFAYNHFPKFFDISWVRTPADRSAWSLMKVANLHATQEVPGFSATWDIAKKGESNKVADIVKRIPVEQVNSADAKKLRAAAELDLVLQEDLNKITIDRLKSFSADKILKVATLCGIILKPAELRQLAPNITKIGELSSPDRTLIQIFESELEKRSMFNPYFTRRVVRRVASSIPQLSKFAHKTDSHFDEYLNGLSQLDFNKLAALVDTDPVITLSLTQGLRVAKPESPWLPFLAAVT